MQYLEPQKWQNVLSFPRKMSEHQSNPSLCLSNPSIHLNHLCWRSWSWSVLWSHTIAPRTDTKTNDALFIIVDWNTKVGSQEIHGVTGKFDLGIQNSAKITLAIANTLSQQHRSVQLLSHVQLFVIPWVTVCQASLSVTNSRNLLKLMSIESVMPSSHLILCHPFLLLPPIPPSIRVFSNESTLLRRWPKYWSFSYSISPSNEHSGLISFRMDWLDLLAVQGALKSLLQHHSSKSINSLVLSFH